MNPKNKPTPLPKKLLTETEVSQILGCSVRTVRRRITSGELVVIRDGRLVRIHPDDLNFYIQSHRIVCPHMSTKALF